MRRKANEAAPVSGNGTEFHLEDFLPYRLSVAAGRVSRLFGRRYAEAFGLSIPEWRVLTVVGRFSSISPSAVGEATAMDKVKVSRAAASLVTRGLVKQAHDPSDGRGRLLSLTRKGHGIHANAVPLALKTEELLSAGLNKQEWQMLHKTLSKLTGHVAEMDAQASPDGAAHQSASGGDAPEVGRASPLSRKSAVDRNGGAGHEVGRGRRKEGSDAGHVVGMAPPSGRRAGKHAVV